MELTEENKILFGILHRTGEALARIADNTERIADMLDGIMQGLAAPGAPESVPDEVISNIDQLGEQDG
jgi:hypothetical protein